MQKKLLACIMALAMLIAQTPLSALANTGDGQVAPVRDASVNAEQESGRFEIPFADVSTDSWYYDAVRYAFVNGFLNGTGDTTFHPDGTMTRGMFVTLLARMAGVDESAYHGQARFSDVGTDAYYAPYVAWAAKHGITTGVGNGRFDPDGLITREQMATLFVRYFETFGVGYDTGADIDTIPEDLDAISPWARESVLKLWRTGLLIGDGKHFNPRATASRAEAAVLSTRTDKAVETWYKEPGVPSERVSVDPDAMRDSDTPGDSDEDSGEELTKDDDSDGGSGKTYFLVTFVTGTGTKEQLYEANTLLSTMPAPNQPAGKVFLGWYYDEETGNPVAASDRLTRNLTLYAKFADAMEVPEGGTPNYVSALDQQPDFSVAVISAKAPQKDLDFKFRNITAPENTPEDGGSAADTENIENVKVTNVGGGVWTISAESGQFTPGHTYQIELISDDVVFDDSAEVFGNMKEDNPLYDASQVRYFNFSIEKNGVLNLKLNGDVKFIRIEDVLAADRDSLMGYAGLYVTATDSEGNSTHVANNGSGTFTYLGNEDIGVGDTVAVYEGTHPAERKPEKGTSESSQTDNGNVIYVTITWQEGNTYSYVAAEAEDILFMPDVLPIDIDSGDGTTGWSAGGTSVTIDNDALAIFISQYETLSEKTDTTIDVGDYLAFYTGDFGEPDADRLAYGEIVEITDTGVQSVILYQEVEEAAVLSSMDVYDEPEISESELEAFVAENQEEIEELIVNQLTQSGFFDEAGEYLAQVTLETDEVREVFGDGLTLSDVEITYADGTPVGSDLKLMGGIANELDGNRPRFTVNITSNLVHFSGRAGVRAEVSVDYTFKIQKQDADQALEVSLTAFFEQEVMIGLGVGGGIVWKKKWFVPYIADYRMTGHVDFGTYTGVGITATAKLKDADEPWGIPWPESVSRAAGAAKVFNLSQSIREKIEKMESIVPNDQTTASGGLAAKYERFMNDVNRDWVDLVTADLVTWSGGVDPLHILAYTLDVDFVVSANLNVALGMTYQYEKSKRHTFTLYILSRKASNDTIDLGINGYQLDLYVMGHIGIRAGIRTKITVGLISTKLAGIGLQFETGAYARLWGYFYYYLENWKRNGVWQMKSGYSGALLIEIGTYLDVKFIAEALNGRFKFDPSLVTVEWPLWSAGQRENVYDFAYKGSPTFEIYNVTSYTLPGSVYDMAWMDLKTGKTRDGSQLKTKNFDSTKLMKAGDPGEQYFVVELSNPYFSYNPVNNQVTVDTSSGEVEQKSEMKITWRGAPLSGSSEVISRTITLHWTNDKDAATIAYDSRGGSAVPMIRYLKGASLEGRMPADPERVGYTFAGWYADEALTQPFTDTEMPEGNTTLYAKWTPEIVNYTVEHYRQALNGQYELADTEVLSGLTDSLTNATAKTYTGFTAKPIKQQNIAGDGSSIVAVYYDRNTYVLKFDFDNGNDVTAKLAYEAGIVQPPYPTKAGFIFNGWDGAIPDTMPASDLTFTAQWVDDSMGVPYTVKHVRQALDGSYPSGGDLVELESKLGLPGQSTFVNAKSYSGFTAQPFEQKKVAANGSTVVEIRYARNKYHLAWEVNGGNPLTGDYTPGGSTQYGTPIDLPDTPRRKDYLFVGWYKDAALTTPLEENAVMPAEALTLYAKWVWYSGNYTVVHHLEQLDGQYLAIATDTLSDTIGYETSAAANSYVGMTAQPIEQRIIAEDNSTQVDIYYKLNSYTLTFDDDNGHVETTTLLYGAAIEQPADPAHDTYIFMGWDAAVPPTMPANDLTFTALWGMPYEVRHLREDLDGTYPEELTEVEQINGVIDRPTSAQARTYTGFAAQPFDQQPVATDGSTVVEIKYARNVHALTWDVNGGNALTGDYTDGETKYGAPIVLPDPPEREGGIFAGWYKDANLTVPLENDAVMPDAPLTLYAKWTPETEYNVWVSGVRVNSLNASDVLGDGTVSYNPGTNTMTLTNANLTVNSSTANNEGYILYADVDLTLELNGNNTITGADAPGNVLIFNSYGIRLNNNNTLTIEGTGTLAVTSGNGWGGSSYSAAIKAKNLVVNGGTLNLTGQVIGVDTQNTTFNGGNVTVNAGGYALFGLVDIPIPSGKTVRFGDSEPGNLWDGVTPVHEYMFKYFHIE